MSKAITDPKRILPGRILYHVYGGNLSLDGKTESEIIAENVQRFIITESPNSEGRFKHIMSYTDYHGNESHYSTGGYITDNGIMPPGKNKYNLNRLFNSESDAIEFIQECITRQFTDPSDVEAAEHSARFKEDFAGWYDL